MVRTGPKALDGARRQDVFDQLRANMRPGAYDAVRKLEADMLTRRMETDKGRPLFRVDSDKGRDRLDKTLEAGERIDRVLGRIGERDRLLLSELICPMPRDRPWREIVGQVTGEGNPHAQGAVVRSACANLAAAYAVVEGRAAPAVRNAVWRAPAAV